MKQLLLFPLTCPLDELEPSDPDLGAIRAAIWSLYSRKANILELPKYVQEYIEYILDEDIWSEQ